MCQAGEQEDGIDCEGIQLTSVDMAEIDPSNIVSRRTRGKKIDFAKEAAAAGDDLEAEDDEDEEYVLTCTMISDCRLLHLRRSSFLD